MNEAQWLASPDSLGMLRYLGKKASGRKLRLFAVACVRRIEGLLSDERSRRAAALAERYADRQVKRQELRAAAQEARAAANALYAATGDNHAALAATEAAAYTAPRAAYAAANFAESALGEWRSQERAAQAGLLRCVFGNPFRRPAVRRTWLAWEGGTVGKLAQAVYDERAFERLPLLADALEDAGCADPELLGHLRGPGPHVRGCWAVDLLLGKA